MKRATTHSSTSSASSRIDGGTPIFVDLVEAVRYSKNEFDYKVARHECEISELINELTALRRKHSELLSEFSANAELSSSSYTEVLHENEKLRIACDNARLLNDEKAARISELERDARVTAEMRARDTLAAERKLEELNTLCRAEADQLREEQVLRSNSYESTIASLQTSLEEISGHEKQLSHNLQLAEQLHASAIRERDGEISHCRETILELERRIDNAAFMNESLVAEMKSQQQQFEGELVGERELNHQLRCEREELRRQLAVVESDISRNATIRDSPSVIFSTDDTFATDTEETRATEFVREMGNEWKRKEALHAFHLEAVKAELIGVQLALVEMERRCMVQEDLMIRMEGVVVIPSGEERQGADVSVEIGVGSELFYQEQCSVGFVHECGEDERFGGHDRGAVIQLSLLAAERDGIRAELEGKECEISELRKQLTDSTDLVSSLKEELLLTQSEAALKIKLKEEGYDVLVSELSSLRESTSLHEAELIHGFAEVMQKSEFDWRVRLEGVERELKGRRMEVEESRVELEQARMKGADVESKFQVVVEMERLVFQSELGRAKGDVARLTEEVALYSRSIEVVAEANVKLVDDVEAVSATLARERDEWAATEQEFQAEVDRVTREHAFQLEQALLNRARLEKEVAELREVKAGLIAEVERLTEKGRRMGSECDAKVKGLEAFVAEAGKEVVELKKVVKDKVFLLEEAKREFSRKLVLKEEGLSELVRDWVEKERKLVGEVKVWKVREQEVVEQVGMMEEMLRVERSVRAQLEREMGDSEQRLHEVKLELELVGRTLGEKAEMVVALEQEVAEKNVMLEGIRVEGDGWRTGEGRRLVEECERWKRRAEVIEEELRRMREDYEMLGSHIERVETVNVQAEKEVERLRGELAQKGKEVEELLVLLRRMTGVVEERSDEVVGIRLEVDRAQSLGLAGAQEVESMKSALAECESVAELTRRGMEEEVVLVKRQFANELERMKMKSQKEKEEMKRGMESEVQEYVGTVERLEREVGMRESERAKLNMDVDRLIGEKRSLGEKVEMLETVVKNQRTYLEMIARELSSSSQ